MGDRLLTILQAAEQFNLTTSLLYKAVERHELPAVRFKARGRIRLRSRDVEAWIHVHVLRSPAEPSSFDGGSEAARELGNLLPPAEARRFA
jgi:excisionase family DNA binding protein